MGLNYSFCRFNFATVVLLLMVVDLNAQLSDSLYYQNFRDALKNTSTSSSYFVVIMHDISSNSKREICLNRNQFMYALSKEYGDDQRKIEALINKNTNREFFFKKAKIIKFLTKLNPYSLIELSEYEELLNIDSLIITHQKIQEKVAQYKKEENSEALFELIKTYPNALKKRFVLSIDDKNKRIMAAHIIFNNGMGVSSGDANSVLYMSNVPVLYKNE